MAQAKTTGKTEVKDDEDGTKLPAAVASGPPAEIDALADQNAGQGVSESASDNLVPLIYILQPLSPQVLQGNVQNISGASAGDIWLRNSPQPVIKGADGILFQPCFFQKDWPEWIPRAKGGGYVARHDNRAATAQDVQRLGQALKVGEDMPTVEDAKFVVNQRTGQKEWRRDNGNDLVLTRTHAGYVILDNLVMPFVVPFKGSGHAVSRAWMFQMMSDRTASGKIRPSYTSLYRLTTRQRTNTQGTWFSFDIAHAGYVDVVGFNRGRELNLAFESGAKVAEVDTTPSAEGGGGSGEPGKMDDEIPF